MRPIEKLSFNQCGNVFAFGWFSIAGKTVYLVFVLLELGVEPGYLLIHRLGSAVHLKITSPSSLELIIIGLEQGRA